MAGLLSVSESFQLHTVVVTCVQGEIVMAIDGPWVKGDAAPCYALSFVMLSSATRLKVSARLQD